jgi:hypothetical protein
VPDIVFTEISNLVRKGIVSKEIIHQWEESAYKGFIESVIVTIQNPNNDYYRKLSPVDLSLAIYVRDLTESNSEVYLATEDRRLQSYCHDIGAKFINLSELNRLLSDYIRTNISEVKTNINKRQRNILLIRLMSSIAIISLMYVFYRYHLFIIKNYKTIISLVIPVSGLLLYWFRAKQRALYGLIEVCFGIISGIVLFKIKDNNSNLDILSFFSILGSIYVIVRGLDNIYQGSKGTIIEPILRSILMEKGSV